MQSASPAQWPGIDDIYFDVAHIHLDPDSDGDTWDYARRLSYSVGGIMRPVQGGETRHAKFCGTTGYMSALLIDSELDRTQMENVIGEPRLLTVDEFMKLDEIGMLNSDRKVELLDGTLVNMSPINSRHMTSFQFTHKLFLRLFGDRYEARGQGPIHLSAFSMPQPDIVVAQGSTQTYSDRHPNPTDIRLLVEVSDATLSTDKGFKAKLYAKAGIKEYWILNLVYNGLEVYRDPSQLTGFYKSITPYTPEQTVLPLFSEQTEIQVSDMLPSAS